MTYNWGTIGEAAFHFFGKMSASLSHEIKNVLAIINEDAGLLEDYGLMADKGITFEQDRIKALAGKIREQVQRADRIVKNMNRLAHSIDDPVSHTDIGDLLAFVVSLSGRLATMRGVTLDLVPPSSPVTLTTNPFFLQNLVWLCLDFAMEAAGEGKNVGLIAEKKDSNALIRFTRLDGLDKAPTESFPSEKERVFLDALKAEVEAHRKSRELVITLAGDSNR